MANSASHPTGDLLLGAGRSGRCAEPVSAGCGQRLDRPSGQVAMVSSFSAESALEVFTRYALYKSTIDAFTVNFNNSSSSNNNNNNNNVHE